MNHFQQLLIHTFSPLMNLIFCENRDLKKIIVTSSSKSRLREERLRFLSSWGQKEWEKLPMHFWPLSGTPKSNIKWRQARNSSQTKSFFKWFINRINVALKISLTKKLREKNYLFFFSLIIWLTGGCEYTCNSVSCQQHTMQ